jgi:transcriptional regulator with XRE-family HTH domain
MTPKTVRSKKRTSRKFVKGQVNKWLVSLLEITGKTQTQFAEMVGVSRNTVANIVSGRSPLDRKLASRIYQATGAAYGAYLAGWDDVVSAYGQPYTKETFKNWRGSQNQETDAQSGRKFFEFACDTLRILVLAANEGKWKTRLPALQQSFREWCQESYEQFDLRYPVEKTLKQRKYVDELTMGYGDWRHPHREHERTFYGFKDNPKKRDDDYLTLRAEKCPKWMPCGNMRPKNIRRRLAYPTPPMAI